MNKTNKTPRNLGPTAKIDNLGSDAKGNALDSRGRSTGRRFNGAALRRHFLARYAAIPTPRVLGPVSE